MTTEQTNFRLDTNIKKDSYMILKQIGLKPTEAVNMFLSHIAMFGELPFKPRIPNSKTRAALEESENQDNFTTYSLEEFKNSLGE